MRTIFRRQLYPPKSRRPDKSLDDYQHTAARVRTRYHLRLTKAEYQELALQIQSGRSPGRRLRHDRSKHLVTLGMRHLVVIYNRQLKRVTTAFPPNSACRFC